ncbi:MAG: NnrU family protein [Proteobacteria bacterium]|nr:NnrU family protein [Pseudomonadota bacterium]
MWKLWLGVMLFAAPHLFSIVARRLRDDLQARIGVGFYKAGFSILSAAGLLLLAMAYYDGRTGASPSDAFYEPLYGARHAILGLIALSFVFIAASHGRSHIKAWVRNPMSIGIALWSLGHLLANGEKVVVVIFAMFLGIALTDIVCSTARKSVSGFKPQLRADVIAILGGAVVAAFFALVFHPYVLNIPVVS